MPFFVLIGLLLILINVYDAFKIQKCYGKNRKWYFLTALPVHIILLCLFFAMFFMRGSNYSGKINEVLNIVGFGFITASFYMFLLFLICGILRFIFNKIHFNGIFRDILSKIYARGIFVVIVSFLVIIYGVYNASDITVKEYDVLIDRKNTGEIKNFNVVMFSDTHIGTTIKEDELDEIVATINGINPDIIFLCGDIFDEGTSQYLKEYASNTFSGLQSRFGVYYITGNHEYYSGDAENSIKFIQNSGINVLKDEYALVDNSFYVAGRMDMEVRRENGVERKGVAEILEDINKEFPVILLDHRPVGIDESKENDIDLQLSGHTHAGQIFPINFLSSISNDLNYGYMKDDNFNIIVTSGCGTWGVPIRIGSSTEIVNIKLSIAY